MFSDWDGWVGKLNGWMDALVDGWTDKWMMDGWICIITFDDAFNTQFTTWDC